MTNPDDIHPVQTMRLLSRRQRLALVAFAMVIVLLGVGLAVAVNSVGAW